MALPASASQCSAGRVLSTQRRTAEALAASILPSPGGGRGGESSGREPFGRRRDRFSPLAHRQRGDAARKAADDDGATAYGLSVRPSASVRGGSCGNIDRGGRKWHGSLLTPADVDVEVNESPLNVSTVAYMQDHCNGETRRRVFVPHDGSCSCRLGEEGRFSTLRKDFAGGHGPCNKTQTFLYDLSLMESTRKN